MEILQNKYLRNGGGKSMCFPEDFLASLSVWPDNEKERTITVISGRKCFALYGKYCRVGSLVRMLLESSRWYSSARRLKWEVRPLYSERITEKEYCTDKNMLSKPFVETLSVKDMPSNRYLFRLVPSEHRTEGIEFGLLPTVQTQGLKRCNSQDKTEFMPLGLLPTPMATDIHHAERVAELKKRGAKGLRCRDKGEAGANGLIESSTTARTGFRKTKKITDMKKRVLSVLERLVKYALFNKFQLKAILILFSLFGLVFICTSFYNPALLFLALPCIITVIACINELNKK